ncbi:MAG TPA: hypothetical protein VIL07_08500 [Symbiobacteriaceae bacterium]
MVIFTAVASLGIPMLAALYTFNYGRWAWRQGLRRGAIGLYLLAAASALVPAWVYLTAR